MNRRTLLASLAALSGGPLPSRLHPSPARALGAAVLASPVALPGRVPGDGFVIRHGYAVENTWYNPGWWHTGEDWYLLEGDTAGVGVFAVAAGEVVYAAFDYPGPVVIVRHADDLYSVYGHLDYALDVAAGDRVERGQRLGAVLDRTDGRAPSHLHFELRTFFTTPEVNGDAPRYGYACGFQCPPGPGYWPIDAPEHPSAMGWRNPTHSLAQRFAAGEGPGAEAEVVVAARPTTGQTPLWSALPGEAAAAEVGRVPLVPGQRLPLLAVHAGSPDGTGTSAEAYDLWYRIRLGDGQIGWVQAAVPSSFETGSDGRPSTVRLDLYPAAAPLA